MKSNSTFVITSKGRVGRVGLVGLVGSGWSGTQNQPVQLWSGTFSASRHGTRPQNQLWVCPHPVRQFRQVLYQLKDLNIDEYF